MSMTQEEIEALMNETSVPDNEDTSNNIDDILDDIAEDEPTNDNGLDDILDSIDGIVEDASEQLDNSGIEDILDNEVLEDVEIKKEEPIVKNIPNTEETIEEKIESGVFPLPSSKEHKVVNQLNEVAEDSEEKASQIFDVLSYILDENDILNKEIA